MSNNSFLLKGWAITLNAAIIGLVVKEKVDFGWIIGLVSGYLFWLIDAYYLSVERKYRGLYDKVRKHSGADLQFSLDVSEYKESKYSIFGSFTSIHLVLFYGLILIINVALRYIIFLR